MKITENKYKQLKLENRLVQVIHYVNPLDIVELTDPLTEFDPDYDPNTSKRSYLNEIFLIT